MARYAQRTLPGLQRRALLPAAAVGHALIAPQTHIDEHPIRPRDTIRPILEREFADDSHVAGSNEGFHTEALAPHKALGAMAVWFNILHPAVDLAPVWRVPAPGDVGLQTTTQV
jgi:hypothetical protein